MLRTILFTLYGLCVGIGYASAIYIADSDEPIAAALWGVVVILLFTGQGWGVAANSDFSNTQGLAWVTFLPFFLIFSMLMIAILLPFYVPHLWLSHVIQEGKFRNQLRTQGRFVRLDEIRPKLDAGEGTLIHEVGPTGPYHVWWTDDDILSLGNPPATDDGFFAIISGAEIHAFNDQCVKKYLDKNAGSALLTSIPARGSRALAHMFPRMRIAMIVNVSL